MLKRTKLAGIRQPGKPAAAGGSESQAAVVKPKSDIPPAGKAVT
jgi:hypothetical protein